MKISLPHIFTCFYRPLFWTLLFVLCASFTQTEDVATKETPATFQQNLLSNNSKEEKPIEAKTVVTSGAHGTDSLFVDHIDLKSDDIVQSSFDEQPQSEKPHVPSEFRFAEVASQNAGIPNEISDAGQIAVTLIDSAAADLQQRAEQSSSQTEHETVIPKNVTQDVELIPPIENATIIGETEPQKQQETKPLLEVPKVEPKENLTEEIPSFSEWTQKQLEEAEKKREEVNSSLHHNSNGKNMNNHNKVRSKNYASPDCGAKIAAANPEAISPSSVLSPSRDEYKLNTCTSRIWFIVELCEAIQAKKIDLANFELFSSSPKDFSVSVSDRFPSRDWSNVGQFTAKDERDVQSFDLHPHLFGKYIKVEMHSHYGSEHFCPLSLFRVYGTSEFEVLEKEDQQHNTEEEDDDDTLDSEKRPGPKNLFTSATDAVISIVKKAAEVLGNKGNSSAEGSEQNSINAKHCTPLISTCTTPSHIVVCDNCSDLLFGKVFELLSCRSQQLENLLSINIIRKTVYNTSVCGQFGFYFQSKRVPGSSSTIGSYVRSFFSTPYLVALCNTMAVIDSKVVLNVSNQLNVTDKEVAIESNHSVKLDQENSTIMNEPPVVKDAEIDTPEITIHNSEPTIEETFVDSHLTEIKPTKAITSEEIIEMTQFTPQILENQAGDHVKPTQSETEDTSRKEENGKNQHTTEEAAEISGENPIYDEVTTESNEHLELEHLMSDFDNNIIAANSATPAPPKESVFLRLSNRIKTLERNMSLSSQYLEELSRRYKKQVEEMVRLLESTITTLNEENKKKDERNDRLEAKLNQITEIVEALVAERDNSFNPFHWFILIIVSTIGIFMFCRRNDYKRIATSGTVVEVQRRKSIDVVNHNTPVRKERRPSEEALKISGTYEHLLVNDAEAPKRTKERKRKRKKGLQRSNSITTLTEEHQNKPWTYDFNPKITSSRVWHRQESGPVQVPHNWNDIAGNLDEAPIVLEESDNNPLQDMPLPKPLQEKSLRNGDARSMPVRKISSPAFLKVIENRKSKNGYLDVVEKGHKKSASVDETKRQLTPTPSADNISLNLDDIKQKKEKKGTLKKILKKVF